MTVPVQIRFADFDPLNHVNNVAYYTLMETARIEFMRAQAKSLFGHMVIARSECDYLSEIRGGTRSVDITVSVEKIGSSSFVLLHEISTGDVLHARGRTVQVALGPDRRSRPLTAEERQHLGEGQP